jgi:hypothetical protein
LTSTIDTVTTALQLAGGAAGGAQLTNDRHGDGAVGPHDRFGGETFVLPHADAHDVGHANYIGFSARILVSRFGVHGGGVRARSVAAARDDRDEREPHQQPRAQGHHHMTFT